MAAQLVMLVLERTTPSLDVHPLPFRIAESRVEMYTVMISSLLNGMPRYLLIQDARHYRCPTSQMKHKTAKDAGTKARVLIIRKVPLRTARNEMNWQY